METENVLHENIRIMGVYRDETFDTVSFMKCDIHDAHFSNCKFINCTFLDCNIELCDFFGCRFFTTRFLNCDIREVGLRAAHFSECFVLGCDFADTKLTRAVFEGCQLMGCDFRLAKIAYMVGTSGQFVRCEFPPSLPAIYEFEGRIRSNRNNLSDVVLAIEKAYPPKDSNWEPYTWGFLLIAANGALYRN